MRKDVANFLRNFFMRFSSIYSFNLGSRFKKISSFDFFFKRRISIRSLLTFSFYVERAKKRLIYLYSLPCNSRWFIRKKRKITELFTRSDSDWLTDWLTWLSFKAFSFSLAHKNFPSQKWSGQKVGLYLFTHLDGFEGQNWIETR